MIIMTLIRCQVIYLAGQSYHSKVDRDLSHDRQVSEDLPFNIFFREDAKV